MTDVVVVPDEVIDRRSAEEYGSLINACLRRGTEAVLQTGELLVEAEACLGRGELAQLRGLVNLSDRSIRRLRLIGRRASVLWPHAATLPAAPTTLEIICQLSDDELDRAADQGLIHRELERSPATALVKELHAESVDVEDRVGGEGIVELSPDAPVSSLPAEASLPEVGPGAADPAALGLSEPDVRALLEAALTETDLAALGVFDAGVFEAEGGWRVSASILAGERFHALQAWAYERSLGRGERGRVVWAASTSLVSVSGDSFAGVLEDLSGQLAGFFEDEDVPVEEAPVDVAVERDGVAATAPGPDDELEQVETFHVGEVVVDDAVLTGVADPGSGALPAAPDPVDRIAAGVERHKLDYGIGETPDLGSYPVSHAAPDQPAFERGRHFVDALKALQSTRDVELYLAHHPDDAVPVYEVSSLLYLTTRDVAVERGAIS